MDNNITQFPSSRKPVAREHGNATRFIPNNLPALTDNAKACIVRQWCVGRPIRQISQNQKLTQPQTEAVIWERFAGSPTGPVTPTVRASRAIHIVARAA